jgi:hypothetical protein
VHVSSSARGGVEVSVDGRQGRSLLPGEGVRVGSAPLGWEVPCIARPGRKSTDVEAGGGWVEDLNGLLGFNKGFRGRYNDSEEE